MGEGFNLVTAQIANAAKKAWPPIFISDCPAMWGRDPHLVSTQDADLVGDDARRLAFAAALT